MRRVSIALAACLASTNAAAQTRCAAQRSADRLESEANRLRQHHHDREALTLLENSWGLCHSGRALVRRGLAEWALDRWVLAEAHVLEGLRDTEDPWIQGNREAIEREDLPEIQSHLGTIELVGPDGAGEVRIRGERVAPWAAQTSLRVVAGEVPVMVILAGSTAFDAVVRVSAGGRVREEVRVAAAPPTPSPAPLTAPAPAAMTSRVNPTVAALPSGPSLADSPSRGGAQRALGWVSLGLAGVGLGVGALASGLLISRDHAYRNEPGCLTDPAVAATSRCTSARADAEAAHADLPGVQLAGFLGGGALLATGVILLVTAPTAGARRRALHCTQGPGDLGLACGSTF